MTSKIPYGKQTIDKSDCKYLSKIIKNDYLTTGPEVLKFENNFKKKVNSRYAISCINGTAALHLSFLAIGLKKKQNIIMPAINFVASANMAKILEANIYLADVDPYSGQITEGTIKDCIKKNKLKNIKAILVMHHAGVPLIGKELLYLKKKYSFFIIEDACHSLGGSYSLKKKIKVGSCKFSDISTFSFHPVKSITTGEGGMLTTNSKKLFDRIMLYRNHCMVKTKIKNTNLFLGYKIIDSGFNYRLSDINSALGLNQLKKLDKFISRRNQIAQIYYRELSNLKNFIILPIKKFDIQSAWHLFIIHINFNKLLINREKFFQILYKRGIITQIHYIPIYKHPIYKNLKNFLFENSERYFKTCLSIPIYPILKDKQVKYIAGVIKKIIQNFKKKL